MSWQQEHSVSLKAALVAQETQIVENNSQLQIHINYQLVCSCTGGGAQEQLY